MRPLLILALLIAVASATDPCLSNPCLNGGTCISLSPYNYACNCTGNWTGGNCELEPCGISFCHPGTFCSDNNTSTCDCNFDTADQCYFFTQFYTNLNNKGIYQQYADGHTPPCNFTGIICDPVSDFNTSVITSISWGNSQIEGFIQNDFSEKMQAVNYLILGPGDTMAGTFPDFADNWGSQIKTIIISGHGISGQITGNSNWTQLRTLAIQDTSVNTISSGIGQLPHINALVIDGNAFVSGTLPTELGLLGSTLRIFTLTNMTSLHGTLPTEIGNWEFIGQVRIRDVPHLGGTIPEEILNWSLLQTIYLDTLGIDGTIPLISELAQLSELYFYDMPNLAGTFPTSWANWTSIGTIDVERCPNMTATIPDDIDLTTLLSLTFVGMPLLYGTIPSVNVVANVLEFLYLDAGDGTGNFYYEDEDNGCGVVERIIKSVGISGTIPPLSNLIGLRLSAMPNLTGNMSNIEIQYASYITIDNVPNLSGTLPPEFGEFNDLRNLTIRPRSSLMTGTIPSTWGISWSLSNHLNYLEISEMYEIDGGIPPAIFQITSLHSFTTNNMVSLDGDAFGGVIGNLNLLNTLIMINSGLTGTIPTEIGLFTGMEIIAIESLGQLTGTIPTEFGLLTDITIFSIIDTSLQGSIPTEFGLFANITAFYFGGSLQIDGTLPTELGNFGSLKAFGLYDMENLQGTIPSFLFLATDQMSIIDFINLPHINGTLPAINVAFDPDYQGCRFSLVGTSIDEVAVVVAITQDVCNATVADNPNVIFGGGNFPVINFQDLSVINTKFSFTDLTIEYFGTPPYYRRFEIGNCGFTGFLPNYFGSITEYDHIAIYGNDFSNTEIPFGFSELGTLLSLRLSDNKLVLPATFDFTALTNLKSLDLSGNNFQGSIPSAFGRMGASQIYLDLSRNQFSGSIADVSCTRTSEAVIILSNNQLSGNLSVDLQQLVGCARLVYLNSNRYEGTVDGELIHSLTNFTDFDITSNLITNVPLSIHNATAPGCLNNLDIRAGNPIVCPLGDYANLATLTDYRDTGCSGCATKWCPTGGVCKQIIDNPPICTGDMCQ